jgi:hypothetical protein
LIDSADSGDEARCQVFVQAETDVETLFFPDAVDSTYDTNDSIMAAEALSETLHTAARPNVSSYNPSEGATREKREETESKAAGAFGVLGIFTGEDERFAYVSSLGCGLWGRASLIGRRNERCHDSWR